MNINALTWMEPMFEYPDMAQEIFNFLLGESCVQLTDQNTRIRKVNDIMQRSCLDHVYTNVPGKVSNPIVEAIGRSDHLCINVTKFCREMKTCPKVCKKRCYRNFDKQAFLADLARSDFDQVCQEYDVDAATSLFTNLFNSALDRHAPIKTIQNRKHFVPYVTDEIKTLMDRRNYFKRMTKISNDPEMENQ